MGKNLSLIQQKRKDIITYFIIFIIMLILNNASVVHSIKPFGFGFLFSMVILEKNAFILSIFYAVSSLVYGLTFENIIITVVTVSFLLVLYLLFKILKKKINIVWTLIFALLSQTGYVYYHISSHSEVFVTIVNIIVGLMFLYICQQAFGAVFYRGIQSRFTVDEKICFSLVLIALFSGISFIYVLNMNVTNGIVVFLLLFISRCFNKNVCVYLSAISGLGVAFATASITYMAVFVSYGIMCLALSGTNKFLLPIGILMIDIVFGMFFNVYAVYTYLAILPIIISSVVYLCLPEKVFNKVRGFSYAYEGSLTSEFILDGQKQILKGKLLKLSGLFKQMQVAYRNLSVGELDRKQASVVLAEELMKKHCYNCAEYHKCLGNSNIKNSLSQLFEFGLEKGRINIIDANNLLTTSCKALNSLITEINQTLINYFEYEKSIKKEDNGKMLIAEQMGGTGDIFAELSALSFGGEHIDVQLSKVLLDELTLSKVVVNETMVLMNDDGVAKIILVVRNNDVLSPAITKCLKLLFRLEFVSVSRSMSRFAGWSIISYVPAPKYKLSIGFASKPQNPDNISGDCYTFTKINETKMLFAIADGMGHGNRANQISSVSLSLIESFYKAGFSSQTIISSVNKILLPSGEDNFTTLDAVIVDINNATADFIKIGATASVIKSRETSKIVVTDSLPLGIVGGVLPKAQKFILKNQDIVVLASDGIVDSFGDFRDYLNYINNERVINAQMLAESILEEAQSRKSEHKDDMTVITIKLNQS